MWTEIEKYLPLFESAVLSATDGEGYPYSVRCRPEQDRPAGTLRIDLAGGTNVQAGPASLLYHSHDEELWTEKFIPSVGIGGPLGTVRMVLGVRKATAAYLNKRNLERPRIPWAEIADLKEEA